MVFGIEPSSIEEVLELTGGFAAYLRLKFEAMEVQGLVEKLHKDLLKKLSEELRPSHDLKKYYASASAASEADGGPSGPPAMRR